MTKFFDWTEGTGFDKRTLIVQRGLVFTKGHGLGSILQMYCLFLFLLPDSQVIGVGDTR